MNPTAGPSTTATPQEFLDPRIATPSALTDDLEPIGGWIKDRPEDFVVEELPLYEPAGQGEHIYLFIEKRELPTLGLVDLLALHFGVRQFAVGYAGLKDKFAITRQLVSIHTPGKRPEDFPPFEHPKVSVLWVNLHTNKLRRGHLKGNRFTIRIRDVETSLAPVADQILQKLQSQGIPNRFGEQRFGHLLRNHLVGRALLLGRHEDAVHALLDPSTTGTDLHAGARQAFVEGRLDDALMAFPRSLSAERAVLRSLTRGRSCADAIGTITRQVRDFYISSFQSAIFNAVLDQRLADGLIGTLREGDLAMKHENRAVFLVDDHALQDENDLQQRLDAIDISPSGPMWGPGMQRATGTTDEHELAALANAGVTVEDLQIYADKRRGGIEGLRRPLRIPLTHANATAGEDEHGSYIQCTFDLPRGAFATTVMREIIKPQTAHPDGGPSIQRPRLTTRRDDEQPNPNHLL